ncbi:HlyD family type I secretion periplasmic adaptor subunit [Roseobacter sp. A03A-229]
MIPKTLIPLKASRRAPDDAVPDHLSGLDASPELPERRDGRFARQLIVTILTGIVLAIFWAATTSVDEITVGDGVIATQSNTVHVEHPYGGVVEQLSASVGADVAAGDHLLSLDSASLERERQTVEARLGALRAELRRASLVLRDETPALGSEAADLSPEEQLFWAEQDFLTARIEIISSQATAAGNRIDALTETRESLAQELDLLADQLQRYRMLVERGSIPLGEAEAAERRWLQIERELLELNGDIVAEQDAQKATHLRRAELLAERRREAAQRRFELTEELVAAEQNLAEIDARLDRAVVTASTAGTIQQLSVSGRGEVIAPGDLIVEIVPHGGLLEVEVEVGADRIGTVQEGLPATIKVSTYDFTRFGTIEGRVAEVSPTSFQNETGETVYRVKITLPNDGGDIRLGGHPLRPGMVVTAEIISDSKTVLNYVLKPLREIRQGAFAEA